MSTCINHATHQAVAQWCVVFFLCGTYLDPWWKRSDGSVPQDSRVLLPIKRIPNSMKALLPKDFFFSGVIPHATWTELSRNGSMNMTVNSVCCSRLPSRKISIQLSICRMRLNIWSRDLLPVNLMLLWEALKSTLAAVPVETLWQDVEVIT